MAKGPTIRDVAKHCGVSTATISNVLHGKDARVSASTRLRVLEAIRELQYQPTAFQRVSSEGRTHSLAVLLQHADPLPIRHNYPFRLMLDGIIEEAGETGHTISLLTEKPEIDVNQSLRDLYDGRCDGVIIIQPTRAHATVNALRERGTRLVHVGQGDVQEGSHIHPDLADGLGRLAARLGELGHREAVLVADENDAERWLPFLNQEGPHETLRARAMVEQSARRTANRILQEHAKATAVICARDEFAIELLGELQSQKVSVPQDLSVVGLDERPESLRSEPKLATLRHPYQAMGTKAVETLVERIEKGEGTVAIPLPMELVEGESLGRARAGALGVR